MAASTDTSTDDRLVTALRETGHRVTSQRLVLYRVLKGLARHATAEEVLRESALVLPGLSLPTVYATLDLFDRLGVARRVEGAGNAVLYDPRTDPHHHFQCRSCGRVLDVEATIDERRLTAAARRAGAEVDTVDVTLRGLCAECRAAQARQT